jgi:hypothetical protein
VNFIGGILNKKFDIACTATLRPKLLKRTFSSFIENLFGKNIFNARLVINVDLIGCEEKNKREMLQEVMEIIYSIPFYEVCPRYMIDTSFPLAWQWVMHNLKNEFFFNLEEDWLLNYAMDFEAMFHLMETTKNLAHLRLSQFPSEKDRLKNWNKFLEWNGQFFEPINDDKYSIGWCGHPSLNRKSFIQRCLPYMNKRLNPEKQIKHKIDPLITRAIMQYRFGCYQNQDAPPSITDIGREWMIANGWVKKGNKAWFSTWEKAE